MDRERRMIIWLLVGVSIALAWILLPFYGVLMWAAVIGVLFSPVYRRLSRTPWLAGSPAAAITLLLVLVIVILPFVALTALLAREAAALFTYLQAGELDVAVYLRGLFARLPDWAARALELAGLSDFDDLQRRVAGVLAEASQFIATQAFGLGQLTFGLVASLFFTLYLAFFVIRDGDEVIDHAQRALPLEERHSRELLRKFNTVIRATVKGTAVVAAVQGTLGGLAFWVLGVSGALVWGVLMMFLSLLPAVGAALVWAPVAAYFFITGEIGKGIALTLYGVLVIGLIDNLLRPILVGKDTRMPDYIVMLATIGGLAVFGVNGFVLGPVIAAMFFAVWHIHLARRDEDDAQRDAAAAAKLAEEAARAAGEGGL